MFANVITGTVHSAGGWSSYKCIQDLYLTVDGNNMPIDYQCLECGFRGALEKGASILSSRARRAAAARAARVESAPCATCFLVGPCDCE